MNTQQLVENVLASPALKELLVRLIEEQPSVTQAPVAETQPVIEKSVAIDEDVKTPRRKNVAVLLCSTHYSLTPKQGVYDFNDKDVFSTRIGDVVMKLRGQLLDLVAHGVDTLVVPLHTGLNYLVIDALSNEPKLDKLHVILSDSNDGRIRREKRHDSAKKREHVRHLNLVHRADKDIRHHKTFAEQNAYLLDRVCPQHVIFMDTKEKPCMIYNKQLIQHKNLGAVSYVIHVEGTPKPTPPAPEDKPMKLAFRADAFEQPEEVTQTTEEAPAAPSDFVFNASKAFAPIEQEQPPVVKEEPPVVKEPLREEVIKGLESLQQIDFASMFNQPQEQKLPVVREVPAPQPVKPEEAIKKNDYSVLYEANSTPTVIDVVKEAYDFVRKNGTMHEDKDLGTSLLLTSLAYTKQEGRFAREQLERGIRLLERLIHVEARSFPAHERVHLDSVHDMGGVSALFDQAIIYAPREHHARMKEMRDTLIDFTFWTNTEYEVIEDLDVPGRFIKLAGDL